MKCDLYASRSDQYWYWLVIVRSDHVCWAVGPAVADDRAIGISRSEYSEVRSVLGGDLRIGRISIG